MNESPGGSRGDDRPLIVALGDSTTAGTPGFQSPLEAPPDGAGDETSQYSWWLMQWHPGWRVLNRGVNGERTDQILARFDRDVLAHSPDAVVIIAGVNDVYQGRPVDGAVRHLRTMYERAVGAGMKVVAGTIVPFDTATPAQNVAMGEINAWIRAQARDALIGIADTRAAVAAPGNPDVLLDSPDGLHPSAAGYRLMADAIRPVLERLLKQ